MTVNRIREFELTALSRTLNGLDPDGDVDRMYIPHEYSRHLYQVIVQDIMTCLAGHALSNSSAVEVFSGISRIYQELHDPDSAPADSSNNLDF